MTLTDTLSHGGLPWPMELGRVPPIKWQPRVPDHLLTLTMTMIVIWWWGAGDTGKLSLAYSIFPFFNYFQMCSLRLEWSCPQTVAYPPTRFSYPAQTDRCWKICLGIFSCFPNLTSHRLYTILLVDVDDLFLHWLVINIPGTSLADGQVGAVEEAHYWCTTSFHKLVWCLLDQNRVFNTNDKDHLVTTYKLEKLWWFLLCLRQAANNPSHPLINHYCKSATLTTMVTQRIPSMA